MLHRARRSRSRLPAALLAASAVAAGADAQGTVRLERVAQAPSAVRAAQGRVLLLDARGRAVGTREEQDGEARIRLEDGRVFSAPRFQRWSVSPDGRTVVAAGDPNAPEHAFVMAVVIYRDGLPIAAPHLELDRESSIVVAPDGRTAIVGHPPESRESWHALVIDQNGDELFRQALPKGEQAWDPVLLEHDLLVRTHDLRAETGPGRVLRVGAAGVETLFEGEALLQLVDLSEVGRALVRDRESLTLLDANTGEVLWRRAESIRPVGPHAWAHWSSRQADVIGVLHGSPRRAGEPAPPVRLTLLDTSSGETVAEANVTRRVSLPAARLFELGERLVVDWEGLQEVFGWKR